MKKAFRLFIPLTGISFLAMSSQSSKWLTYHSAAHSLHHVVLILDWVLGLGGTLLILGGIVWPVVDMLLNRKYGAAAATYTAFWLCLAFPVMVMRNKVVDLGPALALWAGGLRLLFPLMLMLTVGAYLIARWLTRRSG